MCNLYSVKTSRKALTERFRLADNRTAAFEPMDAIFPGRTGPVIRLAGDGERDLSLLSWGFVLLRKGYAPKRTTNTRDDKLDSSFWRDSFKTRRCLVPATAFCEPDSGNPARWHWFALDEPIFAFAGIWRQWKGPIKKDGPSVDIDVYSFMTTLPNALTSSINHERSPVLLKSNDEHDMWLRGTDDDARSLIRTSDPAIMRIAQSGFDKKDITASVAA